MNCILLVHVCDCTCNVIIKTSYLLKCKVTEQLKLLNISSFFIPVDVKEILDFLTTKEVIFHTSYNLSERIEGFYVVVD